LLNLLLSSDLFLTLLEIIRDCWNSQGRF